MWLLVDAQVPTTRLLHPLATTLAGVLARDNQRSPAGQRLRLRLAAHVGSVLTDRYGYVGQSLNLAARLLESDVGRVILASVPEVDLVLLVSEPLHRRMLGHDQAAPGTAGYQPVLVSEKETTTRAWVRLPGLHRQPSLARLVQASMALRRAPQAGDVVEATEAGGLRWQTPAQPSAEGDDMRRRELLIYGGTLFGNLTLDRFIADRQASVQDALLAERVTWRLRGLGETMPPEEVSKALGRHASALGRLAKQSDQSRVRTDLLRVLAQTQAYAGYVAAFDLADQTRAARRFKAAMGAADASGDSVLAGVVCMRMADSALAVGQPARALEIATAGTALVEPDPSLQVALSTTVAQAHADLGQAAPARASLHRAEHLSEHPSFGASRWSRMNRPRLVGDHGLIALRLGRLEEAAALLQQAIDWHPPGNAHRAVLTMGMASARFEQDAPEQGAALAGDALDVITKLPSASRRTVFASLMPYFQRYRQVPAVAELSDRARATGRLPV